MAFHVLDAMQAVDESSTAGRHIQLESTCRQPEALPLGLLGGTLDE